MSSRQISIPSSDALPPPARPPVCGIDMPILIGGCCAHAPEVPPTTATAIVPPRNVLRFIDLPLFPVDGCRYAGSSPGSCVQANIVPAPPLVADWRQADGTLAPLVAGALAPLCTAARLHAARARRVHRYFACCSASRQ